MKYKSIPFYVNIDSSEDDNLLSLSTHICVKLKDITNIKLYSKSIDARKKNFVRYLLSYTFDCNTQPSNATEFIPHVNVLDNVSKVNTDIRPIIIGSGPAGLFAALYMVNAGLKPVIIEKGSDLPQRIDDVNLFFKSQQLNTDSNIVCGLGGAGTFSDGKLTTGINDIRVYSVIDTFVRNGANEQILISNKPHIGTDMLVKVVCNIRDYIIKNGGEFLFNMQLNNLNITDNRLNGISCINNGKITSKNAEILVLATGHSARDIFYLLHTKGVTISRKTFAVGVRIEHKQSMIDTAQYGSASTKLSGADYKLVSNINGKTVYTFCMCPGGEVVASSSHDKHTCVNGMSNSLRNSGYSNSALLVSIDPDELATDDLFEGIKFQQHLEQSAYNLSGDYRIPSQNSIDFINNKLSEKLIFTPSAQIGTINANVRSLFPKIIGDAIAGGIKDMAFKIPKFDTHGLVLGVESRSTSPIRINRGADFQSNVQGIYPCGEGAGYAGGIVSAAVDGLKVAEQICRKLL